VAFPAYGTTVPTLSDWQFSFNNAVALGPGTNLEITKLEGIDMPAVRSGDAGRPRDHGAFAGLDVMGEREITIQGDLHNKTGTFSEAWQEVSAGTVPGGSIQYPLFFNTTTWGTLTTLVRVRKRNMPVDITFTLGNLAKVTLLFAGLDPRWYGETKQVTVNPPTITGFSWPIYWPLSWGGGKYSGQASITNAGNIETRPILTVEGPCVNPTIINATAPGSPGLTFNLTLAAGEKLELDTDMHTATLYSAAGTVGSTRLGKLVAGSKWWVLEANTTSTVQFLSNTGEGKLVVQWASAYII
jgi:Phage tail protein